MRIFLLRSFRFPRPAALLPVLMVGALAWGVSAPTADAQPANRDAGADRPRCAIERQGHPGYLLWICNPEGTAHAPNGLVLRIRTNVAGVEGITHVWDGPLDQLAARADAIISAHERAHANCVSYFHVAHGGGGVEPGWNLASPAMLDWLRTEGVSRYPELCYSREPAGADFVIAWAERGGSLPNALAVEVPSRARAGRSDQREDEDLPGTSAMAAPALRPSEAPAGPVTLAVYAVQPGMDGRVARLGPSLFASGDQAPEAGAPETMAAALRFVASQGRP